jgi:hypothetical protein
MELINIKRRLLESEIERLEIKYHLWSTEITNIGSQLAKAVSDALIMKLRHAEGRAFMCLELIGELNDTLKSMTVST